MTQLIIDDRPAAEFAPSEAEALREWARLANGRQIRHFAEFGWSQDVPALAAEIDAALDALKPERSIEETAVRLLDAIDGNDGCETVAFAASEVADRIPFQAECERLGIV